MAAENKKDGSLARVSPRATANKRPQMVPLSGKNTTKKREMFYE